MQEYDCSTTLEGVWSYKEQCQIIYELQEIGIYCGSCVGGIWVAFDLEKHGVQLVQIVKQNKGRFCHDTSMESLTSATNDQIHRQRMINKLETLWNK